MAQCYKYGPPSEDQIHYLADNKIYHELVDMETR